MCFEFGSFLQSADGFDLVLFHILWFLHGFDEGCRGLVVDQRLVHMVEVQDDAREGVFDNLEVAECRELRCEVLSGQVVGKSILEDDVNCLLVSLFKLQRGLVWLGRVHVVACAACKLVHHDLVLPSPEELVVHVDLRILQIFRPVESLSELLHVSVLGSFLVSLDVVGHPLLGVDFVDLFELEGLGKDHSSHISVIGGLMVVREQLSSSIIAKASLQVELDCQNVLELLVVGALFKYYA